MAALLTGESSPPLPTLLISVIPTSGCDRMRAILFSRLFTIFVSRLFGSDSSILTDREGDGPGGGAGGDGPSSLRVSIRDSVVRFLISDIIAICRPPPSEGSGKGTAADPGCSELLRKKPGARGSREIFSSRSGRAKHFADAKLFFLAVSR